MEEEVEEEVEEEEEEKGGCVQSRAVPLATQSSGPPSQAAQVN